MIVTVKSFSQLHPAVHQTPVDDSASRDSKQSTCFLISLIHPLLVRLVLSSVGPRADESDISLESIFHAAYCRVNSAQLFSTLRLPFYMLPWHQVQRLRYVPLTGFLGHYIEDLVYPAIFGSTLSDSVRQVNGNTADD